VGGLGRVPVAIGGASPLGVLRPTPRWEHCPRGHRLMPGRMLVGSIACSCGQAHHLAMRPRRAVTNGAPLVNGCSLLDGPARVRQLISPGHSVHRRQLIATWSMGVPVLTAMYSRAIGSTSRG